MEIAHFAILRTGFLFRRSKNRTFFNSGIKTRLGESRVGKNFMYFASSREKYLLHSECVYFALDFCYAKHAKHAKEMSLPPGNQEFPGRFDTNSLKFRIGRGRPELYLRICFAGDPAVERVVQNVSFGSHQIRRPEQRAGARLLQMPGKIPAARAG